MSSIYYPAVDNDDPEHIIRFAPDYPGIHTMYGAHLGYLEVGTPGGDKGQENFRPLFHLTLPDEGKVEADVTWAKIWFYCSLRTGSPESSSYDLHRCSRYDWWSYYGHTTTCCEETCYQHSDATWTASGGDGTTPSVNFYGPSAIGWFSVTITDLVKDAITNRTRDINAIIFSPKEASRGWNFYCKHYTGSGDPPNYLYRWYIEVEWAAAAGKSQVIMF